MEVTSEAIAEVVNDRQRIRNYLLSLPLDETSEGAQGKWVVDSLGVNEVDAFLAYEDCTHDGPNHLRLVDTRHFDIVPKQG